MKSAWGPDLYDMAAWNAAQIDEVVSFDYETCLMRIMNVKLGIRIRDGYRYISQYIEI